MRVLDHAALIALGARAAFLKPVLLVMVMLRFHLAVQNQPINAEWDAKLSQLSNKFVEIKQQASSWIDGKTGQTVTGSMT